MACSDVLPVDDRTDSLNHLRNGLRTTPRQGDTAAGVAVVVNHVFTFLQTHFRRAHWPVADLHLQNARLPKCRLKGAAILKDSLRERAAPVLGRQAVEGDVLGPARLAFT